MTPESFAHTNWDKFLKEARRSTNIEDDRRGAGYGRGDLGRALLMPPPGAKFNPRTGEPVDDDRGVIDSTGGGVQKIEGSGTLTSTSMRRRGPTSRFEGGGIFKKLEVNRQVQMQPAAAGRRVA